MSDSKQYLTVVVDVNTGAGGAVLVFANPASPRRLTVYAVMMSSGSSASVHELQYGTAVGTLTTLLGQMPGGNNTFNTRCKGDLGQEGAAGEGLYLTGPINTQVEVGVEYSLGAN